MKLKLTAILAMLFLVSACTTDNDDETPNPPASEANYFPAAEDNYWKYQNVSEEEGQTPMESEDSLYVAQNNGSNFELDGEIPVEGFMTSLLSNGTLAKSDYQLRYSGNFDFMIEGLESFSIPLESVVVYDASASVGEELFMVSNTISETIEQIPMEITYSVITTDEGDMESMEVNGTVYEDVISSKFILSLKITTSIEVFGTTVTIPILDTQDVLVGQNYYAAGVGLIKSDVTFSYNLEDLSNYPVELPIATSATVNSTQSLTSYVAVEE